MATPSATVRVDTKEDTDAATTVLTRTFINDFAMNLYGCIKKRNASTDIDSRDPGVQRTVKNLWRSQRCLMIMTMLVGGVVTLAVVPQGDGKGEKVVGVAV